MKVLGTGRDFGADRLDEYVEVKPISIRH